MPITDCKIEAVTQRKQLRDGFLAQPPVWWWTVAPQSNLASDGGHNGRMKKSTGEIHSVRRNLLQDTYKYGTGSRTGIAFDVVSGTISDDWLISYTGKYGLKSTSSATDATFEIIEHTARTQYAEITLHLTRGIPNSAAGKQPTDYYTYIEFNYGSTNGEYRFALEAMRPPRLQYKKKGGSTWQDVGTSSLLNATDDEIRKYNQEIMIEVAIDSRTGVFELTVNGQQTVYDSRVQKPSKKSGGTAGDGTVVPDLPSLQRLRISGKNGQFSLATSAVRYENTTVLTGERQYTDNPPDWSTATTVINLLGDTIKAGATGSHGQVASATYTTADNAVSLAVSLTQSDAGEGYGGTNNLRFTDALAYMPGNWTTYGGLLPPSPSLDIIQVRELSMWDDVNRMGYTKGSIVVQNYTNKYSLQYGSNNNLGHFAFDLTAYNGFRWGKRCTGIVGIESTTYRRHDPLGLAEFQFSDNLFAMNVPLGQEVILDGFSVNTAVRLLCELGNIHPRFLNYIPNDGFPPYNDGFVGYILPKGMGLSPRWRFGPETTPLQAILEIVKDTGSISGSPSLPESWVVTPYYFWQDVNGNFHFAPWNPGLQSIKKRYGSTSSAGIPNFDMNTFGVIEDLAVSVSIANLRTEVHIIGQHVTTYEVLQDYKPLPQNYMTVGFRHIAVERNERYATPEAAKVARKNLERVASLPVIMAEFNTRFDPQIMAGDLILVDDDKLLPGGRLMVILQMDSVYGYHDGIGVGGKMQGMSHIVCRSIENDLPQ